jgi:hypothetical protein
VTQVWRWEDWIQNNPESKIIGIIDYLKTLSTTSGMILASSGQEISKQGLVFTSINESLKSSSSMKSYPNN